MIPTDPVAGQEAVGSGAEGNLDPRDLARDEEVFPSQRVPVFRPHQRVGDWVPGGCSGRRE